MSDGGVSDVQIAAMSATDGRELITRLERPIMAVLGELPLAAFLITGALRILQLTATPLYVLDAGMPLWRIPLLP
jgi:hypothetical protein